jgi:hypothetical protein
VELVFRWIKIGLAFSRLVDQKGIGENTADRQVALGAKKYEVTAILV